MNVRIATEGWTTEHPVLSRSHTVMALAISDTGIGIAPEKQKLIFEAFQQADVWNEPQIWGNRQVSGDQPRMATLLGGEIKPTSEPKQGSTFTLFSAGLHGPRARASACRPLPSLSQVKRRRWRSCPWLAKKRSQTTGIPYRTASLWSSLSKTIRTTPGSSWGWPGQRL